MKALVRRPYKIEVDYGTQGKEFIKKTIEDFEARVFYHEFDHLNGRSFDDLDLMINNIESIRINQDFNNKVRHY